MAPKPTPEIGTAPGLADAADRQAIVDELDRNILVEAAAGTGKTTCLVSRMVALIAGGRTTVDRLSAVTFTVKAAAHLRETFQMELERAAEREEGARRARLQTALGAFSNGFVGTIHSFCTQLLRERPVEAGVEPGFEELDEASNYSARRAAWDRYTERLFVTESPILPRLTELGIGLDDLRSAYETVSDNADVLPVAAAELAPPNFTAARAAVESFLLTAEPVIPRERPEKGWDRLGKALRDALRLRAILDLSRPAELVRLLDEIRRADTPRLECWPDPPRAKELYAVLLPLLRSTVLPTLVAWREFLHPVVMSAIVPAAREFADWRREEGRLNFQDQLLLARDLLRDHPDVRRSFRERFTPILVDEFQDTDPIQAEVLMYLTGEELREKDWRNLTPAPGSLFVVGDPKQSIYRFRRADIETYARVRSRIRDTGGRVLHLTTNFRSTANLCDWVNDVFGSLMPAAETPEQPAHAPLHPARPEGGAGSGVFRLDLPAEGRVPTDFEQSRADAERIAAWIQAALSDPARTLVPADFLILLRMRKHMRHYAQALERRGIPYDIAGGGAFRDSAEIQALLPMLQAIADPDDPVPLLAALRGPLFGVDDAALYRFHRAGGKFSFRAGVPSGSDERIARAYEIFRRAEKLVEELPPGAALARICAVLGWTVHGSAEELGDTRAGNLLKAVTAARQLSARGDSFGPIVEQLAEMATEGEAEEMSTEPGRRNAVQLLTLHRAKGLEAKVVFLADPRSPWEPPASFWVDRDADPPEGHFLVCRQGAKGQGTEIARPLGWDAKLKQEKAFQDAERDRLLYVAATRAKETLVISIRKERGSRGTTDKGVWQKLAPFVRAPLPAIAQAPMPGPPPPLRDIPRDLAAFEDLRRKRQLSAKVPSYGVASVTQVAHALSEGSPVPFAEGSTGGMSWGRVLHRLLDALMRDDALDVRAYASNLLAEEERPAADLDEAVRVVEGVRSSELWRRARAARRRLVEVPFALTVPSADLGIAGGPPETLLQGAIDLLFEEDDGWVIVDYKSDTVDGNLDRLTAFYRPQIAHYRRYWEQLTRRPSKAALYFIQPDRLEWLTEP
ncbi:MAG: UvrD-helicase domain-containing protein [Thermoanaerobaculia bacterium]|nr:UvrD-helicase domain-containing protein [Thermoanaerobaculia bacterium]